MKNLFPGTGYRDGKLYVFSTKRGMVLKGWPHMQAWTMTAKRQVWRHVRPDINVLTFQVTIRAARHFCAHPMAIHAAQEELKDNERLMDLVWQPAPDESHECAEWRAVSNRYRFFNAIPEAIRKLVAPFRTRQWHLLSMAARCPSSIEIIDSNPALAFAMASCWAFIPGMSSARAMERIRRLRALRRRQILEALGFPATESAVHTLAKITPGACTVHNLLAMRRLLRNTREARLLRHLPRITPSVLFVLRRRSIADWISPTLLCGLAEKDSPDSLSLLCTTLGHIGHMTKFLRHRSVMVTPSPITTEAGAQKVASRLHDMCIKTYSFPAPPWPGDDQIAPIASADDLREEADLMRHCAWRYLPEVVEGKVYFYRILHPQRVTVALRKEDRGWALWDARAMFDDPPTRDVMGDIHAWCHASRMKDLYLAGESEVE